MTRLTLWGGGVVSGGKSGVDDGAHARDGRRQHPQHNPGGSHLTIRVPYMLEWYEQG